MGVSTMVRDERDGTEEVLRSARLWWVVAALGALLTAVGALLLLDLVAAAFTLAALVALGFLLEGAATFAAADQYRVRWPAYLLGAALVVTGAVALAWPGITLWALAVVTGCGVLLTGLLETVGVLALRRALPAWGLCLAVGLVGIAVGLLCLTWPEATVTVLAAILGVRVLVRGVTTVVLALGLRRLAASLPAPAPAAG